MNNLCSSPVLSWCFSKVSRISLTHPDVPEAPLSQLPLHGQCFPRYLPGIPPKAQGERGGVWTGLGQVITQSIITSWEEEEGGGGNARDERREVWWWRIGEERLKVIGESGWKDERGWQKVMWVLNACTCNHRRMRRTTQHTWMWKANSPSTVLCTYNIFSISVSQEYLLVCKCLRMNSDFNQPVIKICPQNTFQYSDVHLLLSPSPFNQPPTVLPIQTSPNWPLPSFLISWRDSRGISHISLVFTDKSASLGMPLLQLPIKRQHSPAALSETERRRDTQTDQKEI